MAADKVFDSVLNFVAASKLNFSIYRTPFSAQLSLRKTFANHFSDNTCSDDIKTSDEVEETSEKLKLLEKRLQEILKEKEHLHEANHDNLDKIDDLETKCKTLEESLRF